MCFNDPSYSPFSLLTLLPKLSSPHAWNAVANSPWAPGLNQHSSSLHAPPTPTHYWPPMTGLSAPRLCFYSLSNSSFYPAQAPASPEDISDRPIPQSLPLFPDFLCILWSTMLVLFPYVGDNLLKGPSLKTGQVARSPRGPAQCWPHGKRSIQVNGLIH